MKQFNLIIVLFVVSLVGFGCSHRHHHHHDKDTTAAHYPKTQADDQAIGNKNDVETTRVIRQRLMDDRTLSVMAQNVTVVTLGENVTLKGEVESKKEKNQVEYWAKSAASGRDIDNQITIK